MQAPIIHLIGNDPYKHEIDLPFIDPTATLINPDGTVAVANVLSSTFLNIHKAQTKTLYYYCTDPISNQSFSITRTVVVNNTLISKWKLDKDGSDETNVNPGSVVGAELTQGRFGGALQFDGDNDYVDLGDAAIFQQPSVFTISMWFKRLANRSQATNHGVNNVLIATASRTQNDNFEIGTQGQNIEVYIDSYSGLDLTRSFNAGIQNNTWYHLVLTFNSGVVNVYLNGQKKVTWSDYGIRLDSAGASKTSLGISRLKLDGGTQTDQLWGDFEGLIDEVAIYQSVLPETTISNLYTLGALRTWTQAQFKEKLKEDLRYSTLANKIATKKSLTVAAAQELIDSSSFDADGDGLSNLVEYALGRDVLGTDASEKSRIPKRYLDTTTGDFQVSFIRRKTDVATDLTYTVEVSTDLTNWSETGVTLVSVQDLGDGLEEVTYKSDQKFNEANSPKNQYLRIKVESN